MPRLWSREPLEDIIMGSDLLLILGFCSSPKVSIKRVEADDCFVDQEDGHVYSHTSQNTESEPFLQGLARHGVKEEISSRSSQEKMTEKDSSRNRCLQGLQGEAGNMQVMRSFDYNTKETDWQNCRGSGSVAGLYNMIHDNVEGDEGEEVDSLLTSRKRLKKEVEQNLVTDIPFSDDPFGSRNPVWNGGKTCPFLSVDERVEYQNCSESDLKEMITQQRKRIMIKTCNLARDGNSEKYCVPPQNLAREWVPTSPNCSSHQINPRLKPAFSDARFSSPSKKQNVCSTRLCSSPYRIASTKVHDLGHKEDKRCDDGKYGTVNRNSLQAERRFKEGAREGTPYL